MGLGIRQECLYDEFTKSCHGRRLLPTVLSEEQLMGGATCTVHTHVQCFFGEFAKNFWYIYIYMYICIIRYTVLWLFVMHVYMYIYIVDENSYMQHIYMYYALYTHMYMYMYIH